MERIISFILIVGVACLAESVTPARAATCPSIGVFHICVPGLPQSVSKGLRESGASVVKAIEIVHEQLASRTFIEPHHFPPKEYAAYGIVAFPALATAANRDRYMSVCEAYVTTLPKPGDLTVPLAKQMVTVWPVDSKSLAIKLAADSTPSVCAAAVDHYHLATALYAISDAKTAGADFKGASGPFLVAWAPSGSKGQQHVPVLIADLSEASTGGELQKEFEKWRDDIQTNSALWDPNNNGWDLSKLAEIIQHWADTVGPSVLSIVNQ